VAEEHAAVLNALPHDGVAVINADDPHADLWRDAIARRNAEGATISVREFGLTGASFTARQRAQPWGSAVEIETPLGVAQVTLRAAGSHNVANALAAAAASTAAGAALEAVRQGLSRFQPVAGRLEAKRALGGTSVIDDTYNANPDSVRAAIAVLAAVPGERWLVLGDMGEVGAQGPAFHREVGQYARMSGIDRLYATGALARESVAAFGDEAAHFDTVEALAAELVSLLRGREAVTVLVKGSRFMRMERVVAALGATSGAH
jgi:UDP-N-acetylmuramoyl-tripeptide--D-alanyl-D-alanine ligase